MSLVVPCPGCPTKLSAPESAAGKQIRCPKCKAVVAVPALIPAEEVPVVEAKVTAPAPKPGPKPRAAADDEEAPRAKRSRRDEEDEDDTPRKKKRRPADDDDEEDERPRMKKRRPAASGGGGARIALLVIGGLILLGGIGFGIYLLVGKGGAFAKKAPVPAGWNEYSYPQDGFKAYFPTAPEVLVNNHNPFQFGVPAGGFAGGNELAEVESVSVYVCGDALFGGRAGGVSVTVTVQRFRNGVPRSLRNNVSSIRSAKYGNMEARRVRWLGYDAGELVLGSTVMRVVYTDNAQITVQLAGPNGTRATPEVENGFFDNFQLTK